MSIHIEPSDSSLGAVITGVDLNALNDQSWLAVEAAWHKYAVLIFPQQHINEAQHVALGQRIGPIEILAADRKAVAISNQKPDGGLLGPDSGYYQILRGNEGWHTDSSYMPVSARASILAAEVLPDAGGETQWADMRAAYQALSGSCANVSTVLRLITLCITPKLKLVIKQAQDPVTAWAINLRHYALW